MKLECYTVVSVHTRRQTPRHNTDDIDTPCTRVDNNDRINAVVK